MVSARNEITNNKKAFQSKANHPFANRWEVFKWMSLNRSGRGVPSVHEGKGREARVTPPPREQIDRTENITFPKTEYAGGNEKVWQYEKGMVRGEISFAS